jgi:hypothetical protein
MILHSGILNTERRPGVTDGKRLDDPHASAAEAEMEFEGY